MCRLSVGCWKQRQTALLISKQSRTNYPAKEAAFQDCFTTAAALTASLTERFYRHTHTYRTLCVQNFRTFCILSLCTLFFPQHNQPCLCTLIHSSALGSGFTAVKCWGAEVHVTRNRNFQKKYLRSVRMSLFSHVCNHSSRKVPALLPWTMNNPTWM